VIRAATRDDLPVLRQLWGEFGAEVEDAPWRDSDQDEELAEIQALLVRGVVLLAEDEGRATGLAFGAKTGRRVAELRGLYVRPEARRRGLAAALTREFAARVRADGAEVVELDVVASNESARAAYARWGFEPLELRLAAPVEELERRLARPEGPTFGSVHVQTDDAGAVERAVQKVLPRLGRSSGTSIGGPLNGWVAVYDELCDREPQQLRRLAQELSYALPAVTVALGVEQGAVVRYTVFDRGGAVDEYLSVPEFYGALPPGDVVALGSNPTVLARLTGADPRRVREVARTAASPAELPPATELVEQIAAVLGIAAAGHGWEGGRC
jgi:ribosomal protein S18 acetylase RimI-like enzyme